ncbi:19879_t:CDS:2, partial [Racocetra persica]
MTPVSLVPLPISNLDNGTYEYDKDCLQYIKQPDKPDGDQFYKAAFYNNSFENKLMFSTKSNGGLRSLGFMIYSDNIKDNARVYEMIPNSTVSLNEYAFDSRNTYRIKIKRRVKEIMMPSWKNYLGFPVLEKLYYITSTSETLPNLNFTGFSTPLATIIIEPESFITQVESDQ